MFGPAYFGTTYYGPTYFGPGADGLEFPVPGPAPVPDPGGRGSGPTGGIQPDVYRDQYRDDLEQTRRNKILQDDDDIIALIVAMVTKGLL